MEFDSGKENLLSSPFILLISGHLFLVQYIFINDNNVKSIWVDGAGDKRQAEYVYFFQDLVIIWESNKKEITCTHGKLLQVF